MADIDAKAKEMAELLRKQADILKRHAFKTKCWPGDNDFEDSANPMNEAAALIFSQAETIAELKGKIEKLESDIDEIYRDISYGAYS